MDWYPWGPEALARAKAEDRPIFLSVGYAACHWCHVMAHESFEDPAIAEMMNAWYVNVKVDREERPDLDAIYMDAVTALSGRGGWPLNVFLTPDGVPFYGGTYFPPAARYGMPSFADVLQSVHAAWTGQRPTILEAGRDLLFHLQPSHFVGEDPLARTTLAAAARALWAQFDRRHTGWGAAPKFPQPMTIESLLRYHALSGEALPREMALSTLQALARSGLYDHLGGGFHRYATDAAWRIPHFEKMLYDNAQLARVYVHAWQVSGEAEFRRVAEATLDYALRELADPAGGFCASQDADTDGAEGGFFVWAAAEIDEGLGAEADLFKAAYGVTADGNFEGRNILYAAALPATLAADFGITEEAVQARLAEARQALWARRERRPRPARDGKVLTAWNGLMLAALAEAGTVFERRGTGGQPARYLTAARAAADFLLGALRTPEGRLRRAWSEGEARLNGYLDDYTHLADGLLAVYEATFEPRYFVAARELMDTALAHFADPLGGFFDTSDDHEPLVVRPKDAQDNALPSGNAMAVSVLLRLAAFTGEARYAEAAHTALRLIQPMLAQHPGSFSHWLGALAFALGRPAEIALVGDPAAEATQALLQVVDGAYRPFKVTALKRPGEAAPVPLLQNRELLAGQPAAYVCAQFVCQQPVADAAALRQQLDADQAAA